MEVDHDAPLISDSKLLSDRRMTLLASDQRRAPSLEPVKLPPVGVDTSYPFTAWPILRERRQNEGVPDRSRGLAVSMRGFWRHLLMQYEEEEKKKRGGGGGEADLPVFSVSNARRRLGARFLSPPPSLRLPFLFG